MQEGLLNAFVYQQFLDNVIGPFGSLSAEYQPIVSLESGAVEYYEALMRIKSSRHDPLYPGSFLLLMEQLGVMRETTHWMIGQALAQLHSHAGTRMFVNVAPGFVGDVTFIQQAADEMSRSRAESRRLGFEVPYGAISRNPRAAGRWLRRLQEAGFLIAVDRCSLADVSQMALSGLPVDYVKFVLSPGAAIVESEIVELKGMIALLEQAGTRAVALGIEDEAAMAAVRRAGFHCGQGFLLGHPSALPGAPAIAAE